MKKKNFLFILLIVLVLLVNKPVNAADLIAECKYNLTFGGGSVEITIGIDKNSKLYYYPENKNLGPNPDGGADYQWFYKKMDAFAKELYNKENNEVSASCPNLFAEKIDSSGSIEVTYCGNNCTSESDLTYSQALLDNGRLQIYSTDIKQKESKAVNYCERTDKKVKDSDDKIAVKFYTNDNGEKMYKITRIDTNTSKSGQITEMLTLKLTSGTYSFRLDTDNIDVFYESGSKCKNSELYFKSYGSGDKNNIVITPIKPEDEEDNLTDINTSEVIGAENGEWDPEKLCGNSKNCNLDITSFCTDKYVARTLKFLGILLYIAKILVPAIIIVLGFVDLVKIVTSGKVEEAKKQANNIFKRVIIGIIIFIIPTILITIYNVANNIFDSGEVGEGDNTELQIPSEYKNFTNCVNCILKPNKCAINRVTKSGEKRTQETK